MSHGLYLGDSPALASPPDAPKDDATANRPKKIHCCTHCRQTFSRHDHLKRHILAHSGSKPHACHFCGRRYTRTDQLRVHYATCTHRGDNEIPEGGLKGRRRHACTTCMTMKSRCEGGRPCNACRKRGLRCDSPSNDSNADNNPSRKPKYLTYHLTGQSQEAEGSPNRGQNISIRDLLNDGKESFTKTFNLPQSEKPTSTYNLSQNKDTFSSLNLFSAPGEYQAAGHATRPPTHPTTLVDLVGTYEGFWNGPFPVNSPSLDCAMMNTTSALFTGATGGLELGLDGCEIEAGTPPAYISQLTNTLLNSIWTLDLDAKTQEELTTAVHFLLTKARVSNFVSLYFLNWHLNCPILHQPSFDPHQVSTALLISVSLFGAMYSKDNMELYATKRLLDIAEMAVFNSDVFSTRAEIVRSFSSTAGLDPEILQSNHFQNFQAGYLFVILQYWAGTRTSKNRAMESGFSKIIAVARRMDLPKAQHTLQDRISESAWLHKEARIRTMTIIWLFDCALRFYSNYPCRLSLSELKSDLPCDETIFRAEHPFAMEVFQFRRNLTASQAFKLLFQDLAPGLETARSTPKPPNELAGSVREYEQQLTILDLFLLIHLLYVFIHSHINLLSTCGQQRIDMTRAQQAPEPRNGFVLDDPIISRIRAALSHWHTLWLRLSRDLSEEKRARAGMYNNGASFWLVIQLLMQNPAAADIMGALEVNCEDTLARLGSLLQENSQ